LRRKNFASEDPLDDDLAPILSLTPRPAGKTDWRDLRARKSFAPAPGLDFDRRRPAPRNIPPNLGLDLLRFLLPVRTALGLLVFVVMKA
jgi:hypothetical protein